MPEVFDTLLAKGFKFVTVSELLAMNKGGTRPETKRASSEDAAKKTAPANSPQPVPSAAAAASPVAALVR